ncbi:hypothetical protein BVC80_1667g41 [Macleaya cordata]|uniref:Uncharacterized protein n=1 Tax=Macleaya cordata TaxID=56857 RepID=A0A200RBB0_MACCD|nr:hypothetical protein BVC80_1667g41 [Macleaya cordata]
MRCLCKIDDDLSFLFKNVNLDITSNAHSWTCMYLYIFATPYRATWDYFFLAREHTLEFKESEVKNNEDSIFLMHLEMLGTLQADIFPLFTNTGCMGADRIQSGDFLVISKICGRWGGFETLEKWVTGAYVGDTAVCLRDSEGKLWDGESGHKNEENFDQLTEYDSNAVYIYHALLPLHPDIRAKFNESAA